MGKTKKELQAEIEDLRRSIVQLENDKHRLDWKVSAAIPWIARLIEEKEELEGKLREVRKDNGRLNYDLCVAKVNHEDAWKAVVKSENEINTLKASLRKQKKESLDRYDRQAEKMLELEEAVYEYRARSEDQKIEIDRLRDMLSVGNINVLEKRILHQERLIHELKKRPNVQIWYDEGAYMNAVKESEELRQIRDELVDENEDLKDTLVSLRDQIDVALEDDIDD